MNILAIAPEYPPYNIGGGGYTYEGIATHLVNKGCRVTCAYGYYPSRSWLEAPQAHSRNGVQLVRLPLIPTPNSCPYLKTVLPPTPRSLWRLFQLIRDTDASLVQIHSCFHFLCGIGALLCTIFRKRYIVTIHGFPRTPVKEGGWLRLGYDVYGATLGRLLLANAVAIVGISQSVIENIPEESWKRKATAIPVGLNLREYQQVSMNGAEFRKQWGISSTAALVYAMGRIHWSKGFQSLIDCMPLVLRACPDAVLAIAGADEGYQSVLKAKARECNVENKVIFTGFLGLEAKKAALDACDVFVIPSLDEPFGKVALEAMALGTPIVASKVGGLKEHLLDGTTALLVEPGDSRALGQAVVALLQDPGLHNRLARNSKSRVRSYDWSKVVDSYIEVYARVIGQ